MVATNRSVSTGSSLSLLFSQSSVGSTASLEVVRVIFYLEQNTPIIYNWYNCDNKNLSRYIPRTDLILV